MGESEDGALRGDLRLTCMTLGLACVLTSLSGMRMNTLDGIYPVDVSLIIRHGLGFLAAAVAVALYARTGPRPVLSASRARILAIALAWTVVLLCRYSASLFIATNGVVETIGRLLEECLGALLILAWAERILPHGFRTTASVVAASILSFAALQLVLTFLQRVPCMVVLALLPLASALLLWRDLRQPARPLDEASPVFAWEGGRVSPLVLYAGISVCFVFILGRVLQPTLDMQSQQLWPQLAIVFGNGLAGATILGLLGRFDRVRAQPRMAFALLFLTLFALITVAFSLMGGMGGVAATACLALASYATQFMTFVTWTMAFVGLRAGWTPLMVVALGYACNFFARTCSVGLMYAMTRVPWLPEGLMSGVVLVVALALCIAFVVGVGDVPASARAGEGRRDADAVGGLTSGGRRVATPFRDAIAQTASSYGLTAQEGRVLSLCAQGRNAQAIADELDVSLNTAKSHLRALYAKLGIHSQQECIRLVDDATDAARQRRPHAPGPSPAGGSDELAGSTG